MAYLQFGLNLDRVIFVSLSLPVILDVNKENVLLQCRLVFQKSRLNFVCSIYVLFVVTAALNLELKNRSRTFLKILI